MNIEKMFEIATRNKFRYPYKGMISTEDLWELSITALDGIYKVLNKQVKQSQEESLLNTQSKEDEVVVMQIEIIKHIVATKQAEEQDRLHEKERKEQRQKLMAMIEAKREEAIRSLPIEELEAALAKL